MSQFKVMVVKPFPWTLVIRRLDLPKTLRAVKLIAFTVATYADFKTGEDIHPGERRLMDECLLSERSVRDSLRWLRDHYLIYRQAKGSNMGRVNCADVYQLCVPTDWRSRFPLLGADEDGGKEPWQF